MQRFVKAFPRVCPELNVVCCHGGDPGQRGDEQGRWGKPHGGWIFSCVAVSIDSGGYRCVELVEVRKWVSRSAECGLVVESPIRRARCSLNSLGEN